MTEQRCTRKPIRRRGVLRAGIAGCAALITAVALSTHAAVRAVDDRGSTLVLEAPAKRIVSLAPHITEILFAAGAGDRVVGTVQFSDYPTGAAAIARVGDSSTLDLERIVELKPDVIIVWWHGTPESQLERLRGLGIPLFYDEPHRVEDVARAMRQFGAIAGTERKAGDAADAFDARLRSLKERYAKRHRIRLFWQIWAQPLLTVNGTHIVSDVIRLCGGVNVFEQLSPMVVPIAVEAVVSADPDAIVAAGEGPVSERNDGLDTWRRLTQLRATALHRLIALDAESLHRASPRILDGAAALCERLEAVRQGGTP